MHFRATRVDGRVLPQEPRPDLFLCECCSIEPERRCTSVIARSSRIVRSFGCKRIVPARTWRTTCAQREVEIERAHDGMVIELAR
jgi:hypothetical protein